METGTTFKELFLGGMNVAEWQFSLLMMFMGIILYVLYKIKNRKDRTNKLSIGYWFKKVDNILSLFIGLFLSYLLIRFYADYQDSLMEQLPSKWKVTPYFAMVLLGLGQQWISRKIGKRVSKF